MMRHHMYHWYLCDIRYAAHSEVELVVVLIDIWEEIHHVHTLQHDAFNIAQI